MPLATVGISGCCVGTNFYNLGGAHGHITAKNLEEFEDWLAAKTPTGINMAITNSGQTKTREYLNAFGWKTEKVGSLWMSTISGTDYRKKVLEVRNRQQMAAKLKAEERRKIEEERLKKVPNTRFGYKIAAAPAPIPGVYNGDIRKADVFRIWNEVIPAGANPFSTERRISRQVVAQRLNAFYGTRLQFHCVNSTWPNRVDDHTVEILRQYIYRQVRQIRLNALRANR